MKWRVEPKPHLTLTLVTPDLLVLQGPGDSPLAITPWGALGTKQLGRGWQCPRGSIGSPEAVPLC